MTHREFIASLPVGVTASAAMWVSEVDDAGSVIATTTASTTPAATPEREAKIEDFLADLRKTLLEGDNYQFVWRRPSIVTGSVKAANGVSYKTRKPGPLTTLTIEITHLDGTGSTIT